MRGDTGLHNKPLGCGASEVYASGPACEEEEPTRNPLGHLALLGNDLYLLVGM